VSLTDLPLSVNAKGSPRITTVIAHGLINRPYGKAMCNRRRADCPTCRGYAAYPPKSQACNDDGTPEIETSTRSRRSDPLCRSNSPPNWKSTCCCCRFPSLNERRVRPRVAGGLVARAVLQVDSGGNRHAIRACRETEEKRSGHIESIWRGPVRFDANGRVAEP
jgi:hypothetical protein